MNPRYPKISNGSVRTVRLAAVASVSLALSVAGWGAAADQDDEIIELSPFDVDASQNQGYRATSTLAGSRINTNLKDIASAITVVTAEFMEDVAAVDVNDILSYMVGAEGTGQFTTQEVQLGSFPSDNTVGNEQTANRIRGLARADISRNYFFSIANSWQRGIGFDTYNLDTVTISRGPNSILFGQGSAAGIINYSPMRANVNSNSTELSFRVGSNSEKRASFNTNYVIAEDVFGLRVAASWTDSEYRQKPSFLEDSRIYLAGTWRPTETTRIRGNFEYIDRFVRGTNNFTPSDMVTPWIEAGSPMIDLSTSPAGVAGDPATMIYDQNGNLEIVYYGMINEGELFDANPPQGFREVGLTDKRYVDFTKENFIGSTNQHYSTTYELSLEQQITPDFFINLEYFNEDYDFHREGANRSSLYALRIDDISVFRNGQTNPHAGELFMLSHGLDAVRNRPAQNEVYRATATYDLDLRERSSWAGRYTLTGMWESRETTTRNDLLDELDTSGRDSSNPDRRYYLGGGANSRATGIYPTSVLADNAPALIYNAGTMSWGPTTFSSNYSGKRLEESIDDVESLAAVGQAYLWDDRIVGTVGVRKDTANNKNRQALGGDVLPTTYNEADEISATTTSYGIMFHVTPQFSVFYNQSENFIPKAGTVDLFANPTPYPVGDGKDYGIALHLLEGDLEVKLNWFEVAALNDHPGEVARILAQWQLPFVEYGFLGPLAEDQLGIDYDYFNSDYSGDSSNPGTAPSGAAIPIWGDGRLEFGSWTSDTQSEGIELEVIYNIASNWRLMFNATKQEAVRSNIATGLIELTEERFAYWESVPGLLEATADPGITAWGAGATGQQQADSLLGPYLNIQAADGKPAPDLNKYRFNVVTNYAFTEGALQGFSVGAAARWSDKPVIGLPYIYDSSGAIVASDFDNPYKGESDFNVDAWIGYRTKIMDDRYDLSLQLNIRNLQESGGLEVIDAAGPHPTTGQRVDQTFGIVHPRSFYLTAKLGF